MTRSAGPVRLGVVGAGTIAQRGIVPHLSRPDVANHVQIQAICDPVPGRAQALADRYGIPHAYTGYDELLARGDVDAVSIASPIGLHHEQGRLALEAGKHLHVNKTITTTAAAATELIDLAAAKDLRIVASPGEVLRPHVQAARQAIADGEIGTPTWAIAGAAFGSYHLDEPERASGELSAINPGWYFRSPGGGPMYDMTVYSLHGLTSVLGPALRVTGFSGIAVPEREFRGERIVTEADDNTGVLIDFGASMFALAYGTAAGSDNAWFSGRYFGTAGMIDGFNLNGAPMDYPLKARSDEYGGGIAGAQASLPHVVGEHVAMDEAHVYEDVMQLVDWIREDKASPVTAEHARHVVEIIEAGYRAARNGRTQVLQTTFEWPALG